MADEALELAKFSIAFAKENIFPKYLDVVKSLGVITSGFIGTVKDNGALNLYDGKLRLMASDGSYRGFPVRPLHRVHRGTHRAVELPEVPVCQKARRLLAG